MTSLQRDLISALAPRHEHARAVQMVAAWSAHVGPAALRFAEEQRSLLDVMRDVLRHDALCCDECGALECSGVCEFEPRPTAAWASVGGVA